MTTTTPPAPMWCGYPDPWQPGAGCWSLLGGRIRKEADCRACECHRPAPLLLTYEPGPSWGSRTLVYKGKDQFGLDIYDAFIVLHRPPEWIDLTIEIAPPPSVAP